MLSRDVEQPGTYRQVLYSRYWSTQFSTLNPEHAQDRTPELEADYRDLLPQRRDARILDVGCGMGHFLRYVQAKGYANAIGVDVSPDQVEFCRSHELPNVELVEDLFGYLERSAGTFDFINMSDVIEHFNKDEIVRLLLLLHKALTPDGRLVIRAPNIVGICGLYGRYNDFTHEIAFSEQSMRQILLATGFQAILVREARVAVVWRPKRILFLMARRLWFIILRLLYTLELGTDRPTIYSKNLIASARRSTEFL